MTKATGSFELASWDEDTYEEMDDGAKLTRASVTQTFSGDVAGEGAAQWLMAYRPDGTAHFVGLQSITGTIADRKGTVVLETIGDFDGKVAKWAATVVPGSASGDLEGLTGTGSFEAPMGSSASFDLDFTLQ
jgi:hypothetical protein